MTFLRLERKYFLLGKDNQGDYIFIPLTSVVEVAESNGDVTVRYNGVGGAATELVLENTSVADVLSEVNLIEI